jgi:hypothetical protein
MGRTFYTERDIEDLAKRGVKEVQVDEQVYITDVAREKMEALGIKTKGVPSGPPHSSPSAATGGARNVPPGAPGATLGDAERQEVIERVKSGVIARLGPGVDAALLDTLVRRVVGQL